MVSLDESPDISMCLQTTMSSGSFQFPAVEHDLTVKVKSDLF